MSTWVSVVPYHVFEFSSPPPLPLCELSLRLRPGLKRPNNGGLFPQSS